MKNIEFFDIYPIFIFKIPKFYNQEKKIPGFDLQG